MSNQSAIGLWSVGGVWTVVKNFLTRLVDRSKDSSEGCE